MQHGDFGYGGANCVTAISGACLEVNTHNLMHAFAGSWTLEGNFVGTVFAVVSVVPLFNALVRDKLLNAIFDASKLET